MQEHDGDGHKDVALCYQLAARAALEGGAVEEGRPPHPQQDIEMALSIAESLGLIVTYRPVGFGRPGTQAGWFHIQCPRGCHEGTRIDAVKMDHLTKGRFSAWFTHVMTDHDKADVEGS